MSHRPLRVLQVVQTLEVGGVEQLQVTLARFHDKRRLALEVCSFRSIDHGPLPAQLAKLGIPLTSLHGIRLYHPAGLMRLARLVRHRRIDVLHAHLSTPTILAAAAGALTGRPAVATLHNSPELDESRSSANRQLERRALRRMPLVIAVAPEIAAEARLSCGIEPGHLACLPQAVDVSASESVVGEEVAACRRRLLRGHAGPLVVSVGTMAPRKAHELLVEATPRLLERFPDAQVAIAGRAAGNADRVRSRIDGLGLRSNVSCVGDRADVAEILAAADLFVLPSSSEGVPLALLEAIAARTPIVATAVGGVSSVVTDQVTGRLVEPGNAAALAEAMVQCLSTPERRRQMAEAARARVEADHRPDVWASRLTERYEAVARAAARPV